MPSVSLNEYLWLGAEIATRKPVSVPWCPGPYWYQHRRYPSAVDFCGLCHLARLWVPCFNQIKTRESGVAEYLITLCEDASLSFLAHLRHLLVGFRKS